MCCRGTGMWVYLETGQQLLYYPQKWCSIVPAALHRSLKNERLVFNRPVPSTMHSQRLMVIITLCPWLDKWRPSSSQHTHTTMAHTCPAWTLSQMTPIYFMHYYFYWLLSIKNLSSLYLSSDSTQHTHYIITVLPCPWMNVEEYNKVAITANSSSVVG